MAVLSSYNKGERHADEGKDEGKEEEQGQNAEEETHEVMA